METKLIFAQDTGLKKLHLALIELEGLHWERAAEVAPEALFEIILEQARASGTEARVSQPQSPARDSRLTESRTRAVRDMLRNGSYKPAGRAKPSSEYLLAAALDGDFPRVNPFVDAVNLASLKYLYPMSIFDADKAGGALVCRLGAAGESYVFNSSGQVIDLEDLLCVCAKAPAVESGISRRAAAPEAGAGGIPIVNPVRDSMATKLFECAHNAIAIIYAPSGAEGADLEQAAADIAAWCGRACDRTAIRLF